MSLQDFAITVAEALKDKDIDVILTGGAVVSIYSEGKYVSKDADFLSAADHLYIKQVMLDAGFKNLGKDFYHDDIDFSVEFPGSELIIGDEPMKPEGKLKSGKFTLKLLSPTQCVMDRLAAFYHWKDRQSLEQAVMVAQNHPVKLPKIKEWSKNEGMSDRYEIFLKQLKEVSQKADNKLPLENKFNINYLFADDLLEIPEDPSSMSDYCQQNMLWLEKAMKLPEKDWDVQQIVTVLGRTAAFLKILRDLDGALELIETALALIEQYDLGPKQFVIQSLRWADILRYRSEFGEAEEVFEEILEVCKKIKVVSDYKDFAYQHLGKLNFDLEDYDLALDYFEKALKLRKKKGDPALIESTELAISLTQKKLSSLEN